MYLFSVFDTPPLFTVYYGRTELGAVHQLTFQVKRADRSISLSLGGRSWHVTHVDWKRRQVYVEPSSEPGRSRWLSPGQPLPYELCQAMLQVLAGSRPEEPWVWLSKRARSALEDIRMTYEWAETQATALVSDSNGVSWWTFGGGVLNNALAECLEGHLGGIRYDNFAPRFKDERTITEIADVIRAFLAAEQDAIYPRISDEVREDYKFGECVPVLLLEAMIKQRFSCGRAWRELRQTKVKVIRVAGYENLSVRADSAG